jgi:hypothetical protein
MTGCLGPWLFARMENVPGFCNVRPGAESQGIMVLMVLA